MTSKLYKLSKQFRSFKSSSIKKKYPKRLIDKAIEAISTGVSKNDLGEAIGVHPTTISNWCNKYRQVEKFLPIQVVADHTCKSINVTTPTGYVITGLSKYELADLLPLLR
jgi:hypothetical protein